MKSKISCLFAVWDTSSNDPLLLNLTFFIITAVPTVPTEITTAPTSKYSDLFFFIYF